MDEDDNIIMIWVPPIPPILGGGQPYVQVQEVINEFHFVFPTAVLPGMVDDIHDTNGFWEW